MKNNNKNISKYILTNAHPGLKRLNISTRSLFYCSPQRQVHRFIRIFHQLWLVALWSLLVEDIECPRYLDRRMVKEVNIEMFYTHTFLSICPFIGCSYERDFFFWNLFVSY